MQSSETTSCVEGGRRLGEAPRRLAPLVSIIIVVLNAKHDLPPLLESIHAQQGDDMEVLVIDGGSRDGTVDLLRAWDSRIDYWISERDTGLYDAMNKGIAAATGEYILHLNVGDKLRFIPHEELVECRARCVDVATFCVLTDDDGVYKPRTGFLLRIDNTWHHQGTFYRRLAHPGYDTRYQVFGDLNLNQRMLKDGRSVSLFSDVVADHRNDGLSMSGVGFHEVYRSIRDNFGMAYVVLAFLWFKFKGMRKRAKRIATRFTLIDRDARQ